MKQKHMTKEMRERIEKGIREGESLKEIAKAIDKDPTTVLNHLTSLYFFLLYKAYLNT